MLFRSYFTNKLANKLLETQRSVVECVAKPFFEQDYEKAAQITKYILSKHPVEHIGSPDAGLDIHEYLYFRDSLYLVLSISQNKLGQYLDSVNTRFQINNRFIFSHEIGLEPGVVWRLINLSIQRDCVVHNLTPVIPQHFRFVSEDDMSTALTVRDSLYTNKIQAQIDMDEGLIRYGVDESMGFKTDKDILKIVECALNYIIRTMPCDITHLRNNPLFRVYSHSELKIMNSISYT